MRGAIVTVIHCCRCCCHLSRQSQRNRGLAESRGPGRCPAAPSVTPSPSLHRLVELSSAVPIGPHWGVLSKCLAYGKAASDPFVYSLLRHQYRNGCKEMLNRVLNRHPLRSSGLTGGSHSQNILPVSE